MIIRTYLNKNNTLIYNSNSNTGKNPVTELYYGGDINNNKLFTRFIFSFDLQRIKDFRIKGMYPDLNKFTHKLRMTNTGAFDKQLLGGKTSDGKSRASSFNLNVFTINQPWDEGVGYDYEAQKFFTSVDQTVISVNPSNWAESRTGVPWTNGGGVFSNWSSGTTIIATQHFDNGNENINIDISNEINGYLSGNTNNGLGIAFDEALENLITDNLQYTGFFTRHTQTFFEPYIESTYNEQIIDSRGNFYMDKLNKLYLYINVGGAPTNADSMSAMTVNINDDNGNLFSAFTSSSITNVSQGIYSIDLLIPSSGNTCTLYEDIWDGIAINGISRPPIELEFELKDSNEYYLIGSDITQSKKFTFNISGINDKENIKRGDIRKISIMARIPYTINQQEVLDSLEYRLYIKEGKGEYTVIDYTPVNLAFNYNYFLLDTASLIPQTYYLDIKSSSNYEIKTTKNIVRFDIVNESDKRNS